MAEETCVNGCRSNTDSARERGGASLYGSLKWHPSSSACSIYSAINQRRVKQVTKGETSLVRLRLDKEIRPIRSSLDDEHDSGDDDDDDDDVAAAGPQGSHKICKDAPREVASALISAWTPLLLMAFSNADVLDAGNGKRMDKESKLVINVIKVMGSKGDYYRSDRPK